MVLNDDFLKDPLKGFKGGLGTEKLKFFIPHALIAFSLWGSSLEAATLHVLDEMNTLSIPISQEGMTRMAVKGDRIAGIYGITGEYTLEADEELGQVFLRPNLTNAQNAISLTLTTEGGVTQDLKLVLKDMTPEAIVLQKPQQTSLDPSLQQTRGKPLEREGALASSSITREEVILLLESLREGLIPSGYQSIAVDLRQQEESSLLIKEVKSTKLQGLVFEVENTSSEPLQLEEASFGDHPKTLAVALKNKILNPGERTEVYVVRIL